MSTNPSTVKHAMLIIKVPIQFLNTGQTLLIGDTNSIYVIFQAIAMDVPDILGETSMLQWSGFYTTKTRQLIAGKKTGIPIINLRRSSSCGAGKCWWYTLIHPCVCYGYKIRSGALPVATCRLIVSKWFRTSCASPRCSLPTIVFDVSCKLCTLVASSQKSCPITSNRAWSLQGNPHG